MLEDGWIFADKDNTFKDTTVDKVNGLKGMREVYRSAEPGMYITIHRIFSY